MNANRPIVHIAIIALVMLLCGVSGRAQNVGALSGRVTDSTNAVMSGVTIEIKNLDTGAARVVTTDTQGDYRAPELSLGKYQIEAAFTGFQKMMRTGIQLTSGRDATVNFQLRVGGVQELVTVVGDAPLIETNKSEMGGLISREQISELPLRNRDFSQLITLQAGTVQYRHQTGDSPDARGARISVSGARPTANSFTLDGADVNSARQLIPTGVDGSMLGVEAIREFKVLSSNYSAQHGRAAGANFLAVSRSGTNTFHGSAFEYFRNDKLDSALWEDNAFGFRKQQRRRNQFGGSFGGPVKRDRLFFFTTYEGVRERLPQTFVAQVPTNDARSGVLEVLQADGSCRVANVSVASGVRPYLDLWPKATGTEEGCRLSADYARTDMQPTTADYLSVRLDYQFLSNHSLFGRYTFDDSDAMLPNVLNLYADDQNIRNQYATLEERSILSPTVINSVRLAFSRSAPVSDVAQINPPRPELSFVAGRPMGGFAVGDGITSVSAGFDATNPRVMIYNAYQIYDDLVWERSRHSVKLGMALERFVYNRRNISRLGGAWTFRNFSDFLQTNAQRLRIMGPERLSDPYRTVLQTLFAGYVQDDFRLTTRLTVNLGVRYEFLTVPTEKYGRLANLRDVYDRATTTGDPLYPNPTKNNFSPRVGFAWDPTGAGKTSVRAGAALFYEPLLARTYQNSIDRQPPFWLDIDVPQAQLPGLFPNLTPHLERLATGPQALHVVDFHIKDPYTIQSSLAIQRLIATGTVLDVGYTWTRGVHLHSRSNLGIPQPIELADGRWFFPDPTNSNVPLLNPNFQRIELYGTGAFSNYHGFRATLSRESAQGLRFQAAYTWSKAMDTQSTTISAELAGTSVQNAFDIPSDYGLSDFHAGQNFVTNLTYDLPFGPGAKWAGRMSGILGAIIGGWQVSSVVTAQSGSPFSVSGDGAITHRLNAGGSRVDLKPGSNNNPVFGDRNHMSPNAAGFLWFDKASFVNQQPGFYGNLGRNTLIGPGAVSMDFSVLKNTAWGEGRNVQFRAEFFNLLNTPRFSQPNASFTSASIGRITSTVGQSARQVQLALRLSF